ncbi:amidohydrolase family protein [Kordiimonas sp. SCSIO 12610]|uniref:amidohydrolase family protein n=1 Tax=Kordiimonas sp. SCSIO 12610 TaxID=2829597 RepID=UPI00210ACCBF|nr:amidohydrolase family protein [Kordiimonas sp. SCSIO 12610]UTW55983.1 amidohydrolase family protein [Kordiimonas sp. SCSIO 12610]
MSILKTLKGASVAVAIAGASLSGVFAEDIAITGGTAFTKGGKGKVENATILVADGKITSVTAGGDVPSGYRVIDASGQWVTVGLMATGTTLGLTEVPLSGSLNDATAGSAKNTIGLDVTYAIDPSSTLIPVTRIEGITRAVTGLTNTKDYWLGQGAVIHLGNGFDLVEKQGAYIGLQISEGAASKAGGSRAALWQEIYAKLEDARPEPEADAKGDEKAEKKDGKKKKPSAEAKALKRLFDGKTSLMVTANRAADILQVIRLKKHFGFNVILNEGVEAWRVADELAKADIPVVLDALESLPQSFETLGATQTNAGRLAKAGVTIAITGKGSHNARLMPQNAGNAVSNGLSWEAAMDAMTVGPAEIFGLSDSYGTLEAGKDADIVVWDGDPIEVMTSPTAVLIKGDQIELVSRQTRLRDRYLDLTRSPQFKK